MRRKELDFDFLLLQALRLHFYSGSNDALTSYIPSLQNGSTNSRERLHEENRDIIAVHTVQREQDQEKESIPSNKQEV